MDALAVPASPVATDAGFAQAAEVRWLEAVAEVSAALMLADPDSALEVVARGALRAARGTLAAVVTPAGDDMVTVAAAAGADSGTLAGQVITGGEATMWREASSIGLPVVVEDVATDPRAAESPLFGQLQLGPLMMVPLVAVEGQLGALTIGRHAGSAPFTPAEVAALASFARHVALTLRFGRTHASEQHRRAWWEATAQVTNALLAADPIEAMDTVVAAARAAVGARRAVLAVADAEGAPIVVQAADGPDAASLRGMTVPYETEPMFAEAVAARRARTVVDPGTDPRLPPSSVLGASPSGAPVGPVLVAPVLMDRPRAGCLALSRHEGADRFTALDVEMATRFAAHAALTLRFTRLFAEVRRGRAWSEVSARSVQALLAARSDEALRAVAQGVLQVAEADLVAVETARDDAVDVVTALGPDARDIVGRTVPVAAAPLLREVMSSGRPLLFDARTDARAGGSPALRDVTAGPVLVVPLSDHTGVAGILVIGRGPGGGAFTPDEVVLAQRFASHAALALRFSQLYDAAQRGRAWLEASTRSVSTLLTSDQSLRAVAQGLLRVADADVVAVVVPEGDSVFVASAVGPGAEDLVGRTVAAADAARLREVITSGAPLAIDDPAAGGWASLSSALAGMLMGPVLVAPLADPAGPAGALVIGRGPGQEPFTPTEVDLAQGFASHAGLVLRFTRRYDDARKGRAWSDASIRAVNALLSAPAGEGLAAFAQILRPVADASVVEIGIRSGDMVTVVSSRGPGSAGPAGDTVAMDQAALVGDVIAGDGPVMIADASGDERITRSPTLAGGRLGPVLAVPLADAGGTYGALIIGRASGAEAFTPVEIELAGGFAAHTSLALRAIRSHE